MHRLPEARVRERIKKEDVSKRHILSFLFGFVFDFFVYFAPEYRLFRYSTISFVIL